MKKYKYILFDMDGTITDSYEAVTRSFVYALEYYGVTDYDKSKLRLILGPPLRESFEKLFDFGKEKSLAAVEKYRERYKKCFLKEHKIFPGVRELLENLQKDGFLLVLATSKPLVSAEAILEHFDLKKYFYFVGGASLDTSRDTKEKVLEYIFEKCEIDKSQAVMVGDRCYDLIGAECMGIDAIGVLYGYGDRAELEQYPNVYLAKTPQDVYDFLSKQTGEKYGKQSSCKNC